MKQLSRVYSGIQIFNWPDMQKPFDWPDMRPGCRCLKTIIDSSQKLFKHFDRLLTHHTLGYKMTKSCLDEFDKSYFWSRTFEIGMELMANRPEPRSGPICGT